MSVALSVCLSTARTLLNDDLGSLWTDVALIPKAQQAHKELQQKLRAVAAPVMRASYTETLAIGATVFASPPTNLIEPISLMETDSTPTIANYVPMTEADPLPINLARAANLVYWQWKDEVVTFIGATTSRTVTMLYWRSLNLPAVNTDLIGFINGELYLAPRIAALAAGSVGNKDVAAMATQLAEASLSDVISANRGRGNPGMDRTMRP